MEKKIAPCSRNFRGAGRTCQWLCPGLLLGKAAAGSQNTA